MSALDESRRSAWDSQNHVAEFRRLSRAFPAYPHVKSHLLALVSALLCNPVYGLERLMNPRGPGLCVILAGQRLTGQIEDAVIFSKRPHLNRS